jgi:hypothetical protein
MILFFFLEKDRVSSILVYHFSGCSLNFGPISIFKTLDLNILEMKEIISIHVGQVGLGIGESSWELFCM